MKFRKEESYFLLCFVMCIYFFATAAIVEEDFDNSNARMNQNLQKHFIGRRSLDSDVYFNKTWNFSFTTVANSLSNQTVLTESTEVIHKKELHPYFQMFPEYQDNKTQYNGTNSTVDYYGDIGIQNNENENEEFLEARYLRPENMSESEVLQLLEAHNSARSQIYPVADEMLKLSWDYYLEENSWNRVKDCVFSQSSKYQRHTVNFSNVGENIWVGWGSQSFEPEKVIETWKDEVKYFDPALQSCLGGACENYVQLMWFKTYKVGCAWKKCEQLQVFGYERKEAIYLVCQYGDRGAEMPYLAHYRGESCSFCHKDDICVDNLCTNAERDKTTGIQPWIDTTEPLINPEALTAIIVVGSLILVTLMATSLIALAAKIHAREQAITEYHDGPMSVGRDGSRVQNNAISRPGHEIKHNYTIQDEDEMWI